MTAKVVPWWVLVLQVPLVSDGVHGDGGRDIVFYHDGRNARENLRRQGRWCKGGDATFGPDDRPCSSERGGDSSAMGGQGEVHRR